MKRCGKEEKARLVGEWEQSGKSKRAFAQELGLNVQTFTNWTRTRNGAAEQGFVELAKKPERARRNAGTALVAAGEALVCRELAVERGDIRVRLPAGATRAELALVIAALEVMP
jgi:transposase-like protein